MSLELQNINTKDNNDSDNNQINQDETFMDTCKMKIYVLYLNCRSLLSYLVCSLNNTAGYNDGISPYIYMSAYMNEKIVYILGKRNVSDLKWIQENTKDIQYFSYRNKISVPLANFADNDIGWGCMIRTGQMMLCQALTQALSQQLSQTSNYKNKNKDEIISLFFDYPEADFSIHKITDCGARYHIPVGKWFNPTGLGYTLKELVSQSPTVSPHLRIVIARDGAIYEDEIMEVLNNNQKILILIPIMLGMDKINESYYSPLLKCFEIPSNVGIVGGKPRQSFYFIGKQNDNIFFMDPHTVQPAFLNINNNDKKISKDMNEKINYIDVSDLDPCMLVCFLVSSHQEFKDWKREINKCVNSDTGYPIFSIQESQPEISDCLMEDTGVDETDEWVDM